MQIEVRGDKVVIDGYVNAVGRDSRPIRCQTGDFVEQVEPGVFGKALKRAKNIKLLLNHRTDRELGSTADGNLTLTEDSIGLRAHAEIGDEEVIRKARNHQLSGWSFGMYVNESEMEQRSNAIPRRKLKDIDMFEVSVIDTTMLPCYAGTSVECRAEGENAALLETRAYDDAVEVTEKLPENYFDDAERQLAQLRAESDWLDAEKRLGELRYNPYHDPTNGRFTTSSGGGGGYLFVGKGEKGKGQYVYDRDIDSEYEEWKKQKKAKQTAKSHKKASENNEKINIIKQGTNIYNTDYATPDDYKKALAEKYNGITDVSKIKNAKDVSDFINYDTQSQYYASHGSDKAIQSTWKPGQFSVGTNEFGFGGEVSPVRDAGFSDNGTTVIDMPKGYYTFKNNTHVFENSFKKLEDAGIGIGHWFDDTYMVMKKKGSRTKKWLEGIEVKRAVNVDNAERQLAQLRAESDWLNAEKRLEELRYNPEHG